MKMLSEKNANGGDMKNMTEKERDALKRELTELMNSKLGYAQINRIDVILKRLNEINPIEEPRSAEEGWEDFKNNYMPKVEEKMHKKAKRYGRFALAACITIIGVMCINIFSVIADIDIIEYISKWTSEILNIGKNDNYTVNENEIKNFTSLNDLRKNTNYYIPEIEYLPAGYEFNSAEINEINEIDISFMNSSKEAIEFSITPLQDDTVIEKIDDNAEIYHLNGCRFKLFSNINWSNIQWSNNNAIYYMYGDFSHDEALKIMNGIK